MLAVSRHPDPGRGQTIGAHHLKVFSFRIVSFLVLVSCPHETPFFIVQVWNW